MTDLHSKYFRINKYYVFPVKQKGYILKKYKHFDSIMAFFVAVIITSNIASSAKIVDWGVDLFNIPLAFDAGTLLFPISYVFGDILTEVYGYKLSRRVIWTGFFALILTSFTLWIVGIMPGESNWQSYAGDSAYQSILGGMSTGGIVLAEVFQVIGWPRGVCKFLYTR